jgi:hypothetical protein
VVDDVELAERGVEEGAPHAEVVLSEVEGEGDRNMRMDVHMLDGGSGDWVGIGGGFSEGVGLDGAENRGVGARRHWRGSSGKIGSMVKLISCRG